MFTRKQRLILLIAGGVAAALLIVILSLSACLKTPETAVPSPSPRPTFTPAPTEKPTPSPSPSPSPRPTPTPLYRLPLVPLTEAPGSPAPSAAPAATPLPTATPAPSAVPEADGVFSRRFDAAGALAAFAQADDMHTPIAPSTPFPLRYDGTVKNFLTVGLWNDEPAAVLLVRLAPPKLTVLSIPCEDVPTDGVPTPEALPKGMTPQAYALREQIGRRFGLTAPYTVTVELSCMPAMLAALPSVSGGGIAFDEARFTAALEKKSAERAYEMAALGVGIVDVFTRISPWELPALRGATKDKLHTELRLWELFGMAAAIRHVREYEICVLSDAM